MNKPSKIKLFITVAAVTIIVVTLFGGFGAAAGDSKTIEHANIEITDNIVSGMAKSSVQITADETNYYIKSSSIEGNFVDKKFAPNETYTAYVSLIAFKGYSFAAGFSADVSGRIITPYDRTVLDGFEIVYLKYDFYVPAAKEVGEIRLNVNGALPFAGEEVTLCSLFETFDIDNHILPDGAYLVFGNKYCEWKNTSASSSSEGATFEYGAQYRTTVTVNIANDSQYKFGEKTSILLKGIPETRYRAEYVSHTDKSAVFHLFVTPVFAGGIGQTEDDPAKCYYFSDLKYALECPDIKYVQICDVPYNSSGNVPRIKGNSLYYPITTVGEKVIDIAGDASFVMKDAGKTGIYNTPVALICINGTTTITGNGSLKYYAPSGGDVNALINNRSALTVTGSPTLGEDTTIASAKQGSAIYQNYSGASLTIDGGTFRSVRLDKMTGNSAAVIINSGKAVINDGYFECRKVKNESLVRFGLWISGAAAKVKINGGRFDRMLLPQNKFMEDFIDSNALLLIDGAEYSHTESYQIQRGLVEVASYVDRIVAYINAPDPSKTPSAVVYFPAGLPGISAKNVAWYDLSAGRSVGSGELFVAGHSYRVTMKIVSDGSVYFATNSSGAPSVSMELNGKTPTLSKSGGTADREFFVSLNIGVCPYIINEVEVSAVPPAGGARASILPSAKGVNYEVMADSTEWYDNTTGRALSSSDTFVTGRSYRLSIWLKAKNGYSFNVDSSLSPDVKGYVNGDAVTVQKAYSQSASEIVEINYNFTAIDQTVSKVVITGIQIPIPGAKADYSKAKCLDSRYYIDHIYWEGTDGVVMEGDTFIKGREYRLEVKILPAKFDGAALYKFSPSVRVYLNGIESTGDDLFASGSMVYAYTSMICDNISDPGALVGDVNGDGEVNMKDVLKLRRLIAGLETYEDGAMESRADVNPDGEVNMKDVLKLRRLIAGLE